MSVIAKQMVKAESKHYKSKGKFIKLRNYLFYNVFKNKTTAKTWSEALVFSDVQLYSTKKKSSSFCYFLTKHNVKFSIRAFPQLGRMLSQSYSAESMVYQRRYRT